jgi:hypothetical protein
MTVKAGRQHDQGASMHACWQGLSRTSNTQAQQGWAPPPPLPSHQIRRQSSQVDHRHSHLNPYLWQHRAGGWADEVHRQGTSAGCRRNALAAHAAWVPGLAQGNAGSADRWKWFQALGQDFQHESGPSIAGLRCWDYSTTICGLPHKPLTSQDSRRNMPARSCCSPLRSRLRLPYRCSRLLLRR